MGKIKYSNTIPEPPVTDQGGTNSTQYQWKGGVTIGGKMYCVPQNSTYILIYDPQNNKLSWSDKIPEPPITDHGGSVGKVAQWSGAATVGGKMYCVPQSSKYILIYDPQNNKLSWSDEIPTPPVTVQSGQETNQWNGVVEFGGKLYFGPDSSDYVLIYDPQKNKFTHSEQIKNNGGSATSKWSGPVNIGDKLYFVPEKSNYILIYHPQTNKFSESHVIPNNLFTSGQQNYSRGVVIGGKLYCIPYHTDRNKILIYDPQTNKITSSSNIPSNLLGSDNWAGGVAIGGKLYCVPHTSSHILIYNPQNDTFQSKNINDSASAKWWDGVSIGGKLYCVPHSFHKILIYDP